MTEWPKMVRDGIKQQSTVKVKAAIRRVDFVLAMGWAVAKKKASGKTATGGRNEYHDWLVECSIGCAG